MSQAPQKSKKSTAKTVTSLGIDSLINSITPFLSEKDVTFQVISQTAERVLLKVTIPIVITRGM